MRLTIVYAYENDASDQLSSWEVNDIQPSLLFVKFVAVRFHSYAWNKLFRDCRVFSKGLALRPRPAVAGRKEIHFQAVEAFLIFFLWTSPMSYDEYGF